MKIRAYKIISKTLLVILILLMMTFINTSVSYANSAPPPTILIIVRNAPSSLSITIEPQNIQARRTDTLIESYFAVNAYNLKLTDVTIKVTSSDQTFEIPVQLKQYSNVFTLDLANKTLIAGQSSSPLRSIGLLAVQIILTLILEGFIFWLFNYREKKSWIIFLVLNLLTQGILYVWLTQYTGPVHRHVSGLYLIGPLILGEFLVFLAEMIGFLIFIKEHRRIKTAAYVMAANFFSLIAGGFILTLIPVYAFSISS
jgi:hypothetical protein